MAGAALQAIEDGTLLTLRVAPGASRDALGEFGEWRGALAVRVLERELRLEPGSAELLRGHRSRSKQVRLPLPYDEATNRLAGALR